MLTGQGPYATTYVQLTYPMEMHQLSQSLAHRALLLVPDKKKPAPYSTIKQGATEPYGQFIDRLSAALTDAPDVSPEVQEHLFRSLAFENANSRTRTVLATLPQGSPVEEMLVRATQAEQNNQTAAFTVAMHDAMQQQGHLIAAALSGLSQVGKLQTQRVKALHEDTNRCLDPEDPKKGFLVKNKPATWRSLSVDLATTMEVTLQDKEITLIPTNVCGPMYSTNSLIGGWFLGKSSTNKQGVIVLPGVIDADFTRQVQIMAYALQPPVTIPKGSKIAQIVAFENLLAHCQCPREPTELQREDKGFGSTGHDVFFTLDLKNRPIKKVYYNMALTAFT
ncbi:hypothetical protein HGM15179_018430 [Zosterops borbonicus]|uniref:Uncharacterized protein n=1 Tax=Zosterops borbonicus TaxID=364589 RepID=A0A8K1LC70_9PASS|nr:hypothetical protein HGM15179_020333 [Zosterops borbonicus]TRZ08674.1 hypothetical protein HGM15179_018430 [Zosterops borbonicus]